MTTNVSSHAALHRANHPMEIIRGMSSDWCKTLPFGSTKTPFGPWVSDNLLACVRIFKSVYFYMSVLLDENADDRINKLESINLLTSAWNSLVARLMQRVATQKSIDDIERHVKIFLR